MKIANIMLGSGKGGLEQAAVSYAKALQLTGHQIINIVSHGGWAEQVFKTEQLPCAALSKPHNWNLYAKYKLARLLSGCDIVLIHGNRAANLIIPALVKNHPRYIAIAHSRFFKMKPYFGGIIALTPDVLTDLQQKYPAMPLYQLPNMIELPNDFKRTGFKDKAIPVIGTLGRHAEEKGFDILIDALALLKQRGIAFRAILGGAGDLTPLLKEQVLQHNLTAEVSFPGWVEDKSAFFAEIDLFCLSSRYESFGLSLLEAMAHALPCISTNCTGPRLLLEDGKTGYLSDITAESLADALTAALAAPETTHKYGQNARTAVKQNYTTDSIARRLKTIIEE